MELVVNKSIKTVIFREPNSNLRKSKFCALWYLNKNYDCSATWSWINTFVPASEPDTKFTAILTLNTNTNVLLVFTQIV